MQAKFSRKPVIARWLGVTLLGTSSSTRTEFPRDGSIFLPVSIREGSKAQEGLQVDVKIDREEAIKLVQKLTERFELTSAEVGR